MASGTLALGGVLLAWVGGCSGSATGGDGGTGVGGADGSGGAGSTAKGPLGLEGAVPEFSLLDVNGTSPTTGQQVSPRDYLGQVSAWYFAHAT
ncbi:MAG: hypothetical protein R3B72_45475 [Polyangiaceae bacterium]